MITFAELTDADAPRVRGCQSYIEHDRVLSGIVDSLIAYERAMGDTSLERWPWVPFDPNLQALFRQVNARHFQGKIPEHRCFWFDSAGFDDEIGIASCDRTMGFHTSHPELGPVIGVNLRLKLAPDEALQTLRHECVHAVVGDDHRHDRVFREALTAQGEPGEKWVAEQVRRYELLDSGIVDRIYEHVAAMPGNVPWTGAIPRLRAFLGGLELTNEDLNALIDVLNPYVRAIVLRAVGFHPPTDRSSP